MSYVSTWLSYFIRMQRHEITWQQKYLDARIRPEIVTQKSFTRTATIFIEGIWKK